ncbi:hypothetical protein Ciccas_008420, partial [Cichlidogyrus casuarinus]
MNTFSSLEIERLEDVFVPSLHFDISSDLPKHVIYAIWEGVRKKLPKYHNFSVQPQELMEISCLVLAVSWQQIRIMTIDVFLAFLSELDTCAKGLSHLSPWQ